MFFPPLHALPNKFARRDHKWQRARRKEQRAKNKEPRTKKKLLAMPFALDGLDGFIVD
jgi:hypothetical protein